MAQSAIHDYDDVYVYLCVCLCAVFTVHDGPSPRSETENCMAWGSASSRAAIQMAKMNLMARDSFDMVCCLYRGEGRGGRGCYCRHINQAHPHRTHSPEGMTDGNVTLHGEGGDG